VQRARELTEESLALIDESGDRRDIGYRLRGAGFLLRTLGDCDRAAALFSTARSMFIEAGDRAGLGVVLVDLSDTARDQGDAARMMEVCNEALLVNRDVGNEQYVVYALHNLGIAAQLKGELDRGRARCEEALQLYGELGLVLARAEMLTSLAAIIRDQGDLGEAERVLVEALELCRQSACDIHGTVVSLEGMAGVAAARGDGARAAVIFGAASALRERIGRTMWPIRLPGYERDCALARELLGTQRFESMWEEGRAMRVDQAIARALGAGHRPARRQ
jgi:tetratricopeptide (TPR) repeat protein